ncbi:MAG: signal peptide peptidase SppA [bacterium]|nr:signal peptide peptidase SppA [bacterium]
MKHTRRQRLTHSAWQRTKQIFRLLKKTILFGFLIVLIAILGVSAWFYWEFSHVPKIRPDTVLVMNLDGMVLDGPSNTPGIQRLLGEDVQTRQGLVNNIRKAAHDPRIVGIFLKMKSFGMLSSTALEIRDELLAFKERGKKIFAYMEYAGKRSYFLAASADKIYMPQPGDIYTRGWRFEVPFYKNLLGKIGITPEFIAIGKYKNAPQIFTMDHLSDEYREVLNDILDAYSEDYTTQIATVRNVPESTVQDWIDGGLYSAPEALKAGMIDELLYENDVEHAIQVELGLVGGGEQTEQALELKTVNMSQYARVKVDAPWLHDTGEKVAVVYAQGSIVSGKNPSPRSQTIASETMTELFEELAKDEKIKGIILRVDSGGGGARASSMIWNAIQEARQKKPVVVSMVGAAASGGYMISAPADSIVAYPLTITGSIGIFGGKFSMKGLFDLIGLNVEILKRGENAGMFTDARVWTEGEKERFRYFIQEGYDDFVTKVAEGREMTFEAVDAIARGRVWTGEQALELGLVDKLGGMETVIAVMKEKIGIPEDEDIRLVDYPKMENPAQLFLKRLRETNTAMELPEEVLQMQQQFEELKRLEDERFFAWFPLPVVE